MFAKLTTKIALKKAGIPSNTFSIPSYQTISPNSASKDGSGVDPKNSSAGTLIPFENPFANYSLPKSWLTPPPPPVEVAIVRPSVGSRAPGNGRGKLRIGDGRECLVVFLRNCGCPFAEKTFLVLRALANKHPNLHCIAVSHCTRAATDRWLSSLGGAWSVEIVIDEEREVYANWGLGISTAYYLLNPWTQIAQRKLGNEEGIWAREVGEGGNRWQVGGAWAVDGDGVVRWGAAAGSADQLLDMAEGVRSLGVR